MPDSPEIYGMDRWMDSLNGFNVELATLGAFADCRGFNVKADAETIGPAILFLRQVASPSLCHGTPRGII